MLGLTRFPGGDKGKDKVQTGNSICMSPEEKEHSIFSIAGTEHERESEERMETRKVSQWVTQDLEVMKNLGRFIL